MPYFIDLAAKTITAVLQLLTGHYFQHIPILSLKPRTMKNIVILGASYAGISAAHQILKQAAKTGPFKLTLVSPNSHFYWSIASPRGLIAGEYSDEVLFRSIAPGFKQYPASLFEFILGSAESLDVEHKKVIVSSPVGTRSLDYDFLVLATGSSTQGGTPFKGLGSTEETQAALHEWQLRVKASKTIVLAGGGPTGVETAGELGEKYGTKKEMILVSFVYNVSAIFSTKMILAACHHNVSRERYK